MKSVLQATNGLGGSRLRQFYTHVSLFTARSSVRYKIRTWWLNSVQLSASWEHFASAIGYTLLGSPRLISNPQAQMILLPQHPQYLRLGTQAIRVGPRGLTSL